MLRGWVFLGYARGNLRDNLNTQGAQKARKNTAYGILDVDVTGPHLALRLELVIVTI